MEVILGYLFVLIIVGGVCYFLGMSVGEAMNTKEPTALVFPILLLVVIVGSAMSVGAFGKFNIIASILALGVWVFCVHRGYHSVIEDSTEKDN
jgi:hypothetical protein